MESSSQNVPVPPRVAIKAFAVKMGLHYVEASSIANSTPPRGLPNAAATPAAPPMATYSLLRLSVL